jgi:hypothetical protein
VRLVLFDHFRLGVVTGDQIVDVTGALPAHDADPVTAGWWRALCRDFPALRDGLQAAADAGPARPLAAVRLRPPALGPRRSPPAPATTAATSRRCEWCSGAPSAGSRTG